MQYQALEDIYNAEFDLFVPAGEIVYDGDVEPDLLAQWVASGKVAPEGAVLDIEPESFDEPSEDDEA